MKKVLCLFLTLLMCFSLTGCGTNTKKAVLLERSDWAVDVKQAVNDLAMTYGNTSKNYAKDTYAVFDFDNTCSIFDVEEQLAIYQLQTMSFALTPDNIAEVLRTGIGIADDGKQDLDFGRACYSADGIEHSYAEWIVDIEKAYGYLYNTYGPFTPAGLDETQQKKIQSDPQWLEFATKLRAMYDVVYDSESADVAYPWVLYWFTGMTEKEVYDLAYKSHSYYKTVETSEETWTTPMDIESKVGKVEYSWISGTQVSENIVELWKTLQANGIDVWVCSASATEPIKAAIDAFGLHDYCKGMIAMTLKTDADGMILNQYDYETGCGWVTDGAKWKRMTSPVNSQTQGKGKVTAISNAIAPEYNNHGPIAGFMDSTGDFNFCTEYETLKLVVCFNRASRKVTDGGGLIAELAMYQRDSLKYDLLTANEAGDTLYVLQGRDENGLRGLRDSNATMLLGETEEKLFKNEDNEAQLKYMIDKQMTCKDILNIFAVKTSEDDTNNSLGFKYGFAKEYDGYHSHK